MSYRTDRAHKATKGWQSQRRLLDRKFPDQPSRDAFRGGYSDGFHGYPSQPGDWPMGAYSAGYWEGYDDAGRVEYGNAHDCR